MRFIEDSLEHSFIDLLQYDLGYSYLYGPDVERDYREVLMLDELDSSLRRINPSVPQPGIREALSKIRSIENGSLIQMNKKFSDFMQNGVSVNYYHDGQQHAGLVYLADYENINKNSFIVANQWTVEENSVKRPDLVVFLNGIPVVVFELKSPSREEADASQAYRQLNNYMKEIPSLFVYNAFCVISDMSMTRVGTITANENRYMAWKTKDGSFEDNRVVQFDTLLEGIFEKSRFLDILKNFICYSANDKIMAAYHQYYAVRKAVDSTVEATESDGKGGVFWHTQGSGKSLSMVFYTHLLQSALSSPTIVVLTDRNDLDDQLFGQFAKCADFIRQEPVQADSRANLRELLAGREANGIIFTTAQKFEESIDDIPLSERRNIVVIADEAHRSQFIDESVDLSGRIKKSFGLIIRESLPNATYIGFTGTPISKKDRSTVEVFGDYIDIYDMTQAVADGATVPVYYESRVVQLKLDEDTLRRIDAEYEVLALNADKYAIEKSKQQLSRMESLLGAESTIEALCLDIVAHYEDNRQQELTGKAMIVAYSRAIAMSIYKKLLAMRPGWRESLAVIMTENNNDPVEWRDVIGNKRRRDELRDQFKDDNSPIKIAIVVDMLLTGFDVPSLATMYVYKPMSGHNLMQAIARVNRVYKDKSGGLVVDYVGIASALKQAMNDYTESDRKNYGDTDIAKTAYPKFIEKLEVCRSLFHGFDYSRFMWEDASERTRAQVIADGVNFMAGVAPPRTNLGVHEAQPAYLLAAENPPAYGTGFELKETFIREATMMQQALSLCRSLLTSEERHEAAYFEVVRTVLTRIEGRGEKYSLRDINERINELLKSTIKSEGVINLFSDIGEEFSLFNPEFLEQVAKMRERNIAVDILKKLLADQIKVYKRTNLVKSEAFSEMLTRSLNSYINGLLSNEQVIEELLKIASEMTHAHKEGNELGLSEEELAFYDALTKPRAIKDFYEDAALIALTQELTEALRNSRTIDWQKRESARAGMRRMVKKLLKKHRYPPEGMEDAVITVIRQCELWADN